MQPRCLDLSCGGPGGSGTIEPRRQSPLCVCVCVSDLWRPGRFGGICDDSMGPRCLGSLCAWDLWSPDASLGSLCTRGSMGLGLQGPVWRGCLWGQDAWVPGQCPVTRGVVTVLPCQVYIGTRPEGGGRLLSRRRRPPPAPVRRRGAARGLRDGTGGGSGSSPRTPCSLCHQGGDKCSREVTHSRGRGGPHLPIVPHRSPSPAPQTTFSAPQSPYRAP